MEMDADVEHLELAVAAVVDAPEHAARAIRQDNSVLYTSAVRSAHKYVRVWRELPSVSSFAQLLPANADGTTSMSSGLWRALEFDLAPSLDGDVICVAKADLSEGVKASTCTCKLGVVGRMEVQFKSISPLPRAVADGARRIIPKVLRSGLLCLLPLRET